MFVHDKEQIVLNPMRVSKWHALAEAIRDGCILFPRQSFEGYYTGKDGACAIGAAAAVLKIEYPVDVDEPIMRGCPIRTDCNLLPGFLRDDRMIAVVPHLNDDHRWTRERIADWLDTL